MPAPATGAAARAAETAARESYGRLVALLAARTGDIPAAEDALSDAFAAALGTWPRTGVPDRPEAWLLVAARRVLGHGARARSVRARAEPEILRRLEEAAAADPPDLPDDRLKLMFACAHPAIDAAVHTPLMLQTVMGIDAARIAGVFLVSPATMGQRLVRAKAKIRAAGLPFSVPDPDRLAPRLAAVLSAIYAAYGVGWEAEPGAAATDGLAAEAIWLGRLAVALMPDAPEALGLLSLMLHCEARRPARRDGAGRFVPLAGQDTRLWSRPLIAEAEALLRRAATARTFGRFQCEAAIQSVHAGRAVTGRTEWHALGTLYDLLAERAPSLGTSVGRAAVLAEGPQPSAALAALDALPPERVAAYAPNWAARARALERLERPGEAATALRRAEGLTTDPAVRAWLGERAARLEQAATHGR